MPKELMMVRFYCVVLGLFIFPIFAMDPKGKQIELSAARHAYTQKPKNDSTGTCVFCDPVSLKENYILQENEADDVRIMMNKNPYFNWDQGHHLLIMPMTHKLDFAEFSRQELMQQTRAARYLSALLYEDSYTQEYVTNLGLNGGQSVPHLHNHIKAYVQPPMSLPEMVDHYKDSPTNNIAFAFELLKAKLASSVEFFVESNSSSVTHDGCYCCSISNNLDDERNFIIKRFKHNLVCVAHFPNVAAELIVMPYDHVHSIKDLSPEALCENMALAVTFLPLLREYVNKNVRECKSGNVYTKSLGGKASEKKKQKYHVYTSVMARTAISSTPGTLEGNSQKIECDPVALFQYFKQCSSELQLLLEKRMG